MGGQGCSEAWRRPPRAPGPRNRDPTAFAKRRKKAQGRRLGTRGSRRARPPHAQFGPARRAADTHRTWRAAPLPRGPRRLTRDVEEAQPLGLQSRTRGQRLPVLLHGGPSAASAPASDFRPAPSYRRAGRGSACLANHGAALRRGRGRARGLAAPREQSVLPGGPSSAASPTSLGVTERSRLCRSRQPAPAAAVTASRAE